MFNIKDIKGDLIISQDQKGGITGKVIKNKFIFVKHKKLFITSIITGIILTVGFLSDSFDVLDHFNINLFKNMQEEKIKNISNVTGDVVISENQTGGITAHTVNIGNEQRIMGDQLKLSLLSEINKLLKEKNRKVSLMIVNGADGETVNYYNEVKSFLINSKIIEDDGSMSTFYPSNPIFGLKINIQDPNTIAIMIGYKE